MNVKTKNVCSLCTDRRFCFFYMKKQQFVAKFVLCRRSDVLVPQPCSGSLPESDYKQGVSVRAELIVFLQGYMVGFHNFLESAECRYRHKHGRAGKVEV